MSSSPQSHSDNNMVNLYNSRLQAVNIDTTINDTRHKLDQWRDDCHKIIDDFHQQKLEEFNTYINGIKIQYDIKMTKIKSCLDSLQKSQNEQKSNEEGNDFIRLMNSTIQRHLYDLEKICIQINLRPLVLDNSYICIQKEFTLEKLKIDCPKFGYTSQSSSAIASSEQFLLMHQYPYLNLIDYDSKIVKQSLWTYDWIRDICWSSTLCCFILITSNSIYITNQQLLSFAPIQEQLQQSWFSCTCSDTSLYLSTCEWGSSIFELNISSAFDVINQWKSPLTCEKYEGINDMKYNNETIVLMIKDEHEHKKRIELKSTKTFAKIWSFPLSATPDIRLFTCCPLKYNEWLIIDGADSYIYHITAEGKIKDKLLYHSVPYRANLFNSNILAISAETDLNLYNIST